MWLCNEVRVHYRPLEVSGRLFFPLLFQTFKRKDTGKAGGVEVEGAALWPPRLR